MKHEHSGYGFFPGGDPRRFTPDSEESGTMQDERAAWEAACAKWNEAEKAAVQLTAEEGSCLHLPGLIITRSGFGLGVYTYECDDPSCAEADDVAKEEMDRDAKERMPR